MLPANMPPPQNITKPPPTVFEPNHHLQLWYYEKHMIIVRYKKSAESRVVTNLLLFSSARAQETRLQGGVTFA